MSIVCRGDIGLAVTVRGDLYKFGFPFSPGFVWNYPTLPPVAQAAIGSHGHGLYWSTGIHYAVVCRNGTLWTWGHNTLGQTGHDLALPVSGFVDILQLPRRICWPLADQKIVNVACGAQTTFAVTDAGHVYSFGVGDRGQLGHGVYGVAGTKKVPTLIEQLKDVKVAMIATHDSHSLCVSQDGRVWSWGVNVCRQLGIEGVNAEFLALPTPVTGLDKQCPVVFVATSSVTSMVVTAKGDVLAWGCNKYGQCGLGTTKLVLTPTPVVFGDKDKDEHPDITHTDKRFKPARHCLEHTTPTAPSIHIKTITCMNILTMAVDQNSRVWWSGRHNKADIKNTISRFLQMPHEFTSGHNVVVVCNSQYPTTALTDDGLFLRLHYTGLLKNDTLIPSLQTTPNSTPIQFNVSFFGGDPLGLYALLSTHTKLAFAMGTHHRLGEVGHLLCLTDDLLRRILTVYNGHVVQSEGVRRLCGGWKAHA